MYNDWACTIIGSDTCTMMDTCDSTSGSLCVCYLQCYIVSPSDHVDGSSSLLSWLFIGADGDDVNQKWETGVELIVRDE